MTAPGLALEQLISMMSPVGKQEVRVASEAGQGMPKAPWTGPENKRVNHNQSKLEPGFPRKI